MANTNTYTVDGKRFSDRDLERMTRSQLRALADSAYEAHDKLSDSAVEPDVCQRALETAMHIEAMAAIAH